MTTDQKLKHCVGCRDDFYNQQGNSTSGHCWMLDTMKIGYFQQVSINDIPPFKHPYRKFPDCYRKAGYVFFANKKK